MKKTNKWGLGVLLSLCGLLILYLFLSQEPLFNGFGTGGGITYCNVNPGYFCENVVYSNSTSNLTVLMAQNTWQTWTGWAVGYASNTTTLNTNGIPSITFSPVPGAARLVSGQKVQLSINVSPGSRPNATSLYLMSGSIWVCYTKDSGVTGMIGGKGTCTPIGNVNAVVKYAEAFSLRT